MEVVSAVIISLAGVSGKPGRRKGEECNFSQLGKPKVVSGYCCPLLPGVGGEARAAACRKYQLVSFHKGQMVAGSLGLHQYVCARRSGCRKGGRKEAFPESQLFNSGTRDRCLCGSCDLCIRCT